MYIARIFGSAYLQVCRMKHSPPFLFFLLVRLWRTGKTKSIIKRAFGTPEGVPFRTLFIDAA
ncbi:hypothetical protein BH10ACI4_BH10ACI4_21100 [soil metagenome]